MLLRLVDLLREEGLQPQRVGGDMLAIHVDNLGRASPSKQNGRCIEQGSDLFLDHQLTFGRPSAPPWAIFHNLLSITVPASTASIMAEYQG
jgi:hypothetical protein